MKYLCLICPETVMEHMPEADRRRHFQHYDQFTQSIKRNGHFIDANRRQPAAWASRFWCVTARCRLPAVRLPKRKSNLAATILSMRWIWMRPFRSPRKSPAHALVASRCARSPKMRRPSRPDLTLRVRRTGPVWKNDPVRVDVASERPPNE